MKWVCIFFQNHYLTWVVLVLLGGAVVFKTGIAFKPIRYSIITLQNHGEYCVGFIDNKLSACYFSAI